LRIKAEKTKKLPLISGKYTGKSMKGKEKSRTFFKKYGFLF